MSGNSNRDVKRSARSGSSGYHRPGHSGGGGKGGGGGAAAPPAGAGFSSHSGQPPLNSNRSFKKVGNVQGGPPRPNQVSTISDASAGFTPATPPKGAASLNGSQSHFQPPHAAPNAPPTTFTEKPVNVPPPRNSSHPAPRGPPSQSSTKTPDSSIPPSPSKGGAFPLQFGSINVGMMNGLQIPARTSSAPPNLDEQKRNQALLDASKAMALGPAPSGPRPQLPHPRKDPIVTANSNPVLPQSHPRPPTQPLNPQSKGPSQQAPPVSGSAPGPAPPQPRPPPNVPFQHMPGMPHPVPFQHQQAPSPVQLQFGAHGPQMPTPQGVVPSSLQMTMTLPVGSGPNQVPQTMFVSGIQPHGLQQQALLHQSQGMGFVPPTGHQLGQPQLGGMGMGSLGPRYPSPQQSPAKFVSARKAPTVKITHPDTHEEVKLENVAAAPRAMPNMAAQSQPIQTLPPHMGYYHQVHHGSYNPSAMYFPGSNIPLTSTQMSTGSQPPQYPFSVPQPGQTMTYMNPQSIINQVPSSKPVATPTSQSHADSETVPPPSTARPTVTITQPVKVEAPKQSKPSDKPADASHNLKESNVGTGTGSAAELISEKKAPAEMPATPTAESRPGSAGAEMKKKELEQPQSDASHTAESSKQTALLKEGDVADIKATAVPKSGPTESSLEPEKTQTKNKGDLSETHSVAPIPDVSDAKQSHSETDKVQVEDKVKRVEPEKEKLSGESNEQMEKSHGEPSAIVEEADEPSQYVPKLAEDNIEDKHIRPTSSTSTVSTDSESLSSGSFSHANGSALGSKLVSSEVAADKALKLESKVVDVMTVRSVSREKPVAEAPKKSTSKKKLRKEVLSKADAAGSSELYSAYKGPEEKPEAISATPDISKADRSIQTNEEARKEVIANEEEAPGKGELDDWEDVADLSTPKLPSLEQKAQATAADVTGTKKYSRDFLLTFSQQCSALPAGFQIEQGTEALFGGGRSFDQPYPSPGRGQRGDRRMGGGGGGGPPEEERWIKSPGPFSPARDIRVDMGQFNNGPPNMANLRPGQGPNYNMMKYPRGQSPNQFTGGILSQPLPQGGGLHRSGSDMDRWQHVSGGIQRGLMPSPIASPHQLMHKADRKYEVGKISDEEQAKQRQLKAILNKLTPQNFDKLFEQVKAVNIDSPDTLAGVISQIFDKALMEPTFCEMYANFCSHLALVLPDFSEDNEKITFKRLLLNKCQEEFERGEREEAEAEKTEEEGEVKQTPEQREEKRVKARRRMLGNIRLIGELYKKRMLTERIMHECIKKLLGPTQSPDEEDIEALCKLMSTIGEMIDHPKAKEHMDAYFDIMANLSTNQRYSSRVRFMLKDAIDLRRNKWQQRRKVEGPKKIEEVHRDAAQERQAQSTRLSRSGPVMNNPPMRRGPQMGLVSPVSQQPGIRGMAPPQSGRGGFAMQDVRFEDRGDRYHFDNRNMNPSLPLPQRVNRDESITLGPQGGLGRNMSIRGQPGISNASSAMGDRMGSGPTNGFGSGTSSEYGYGSREGGMGVRMASPEERTGPSLGWGQRGLDRNFSAGSRPAPPVVNRQAGLVASSPSSTSLPDSVIKEKSVSAIREFYSAKDEKEVAMCIEELKSPGSYHLIISTWVSDSFERKEVERDVLYKLLVNLCKPSGGLFPQAQLQQGLETVLSILEDAVNDAPKAPEFLGRLFAKFIAEDVMSLEDIGRLVCEGGEEPGLLIEAGLGGDVIGCTLEYIKVEKGDSFLNDVRAGSNLQLEDFKPPPPARSKKLDPFL
ncbi:eukaryotic translation initiation factor 4G-like isoform X2 [Carex rostrata]